MIELLSQFLNGLIVGNVYALVAIGFSLIFGVSGLINFAQGSLLMLGAFLAFTCVSIGLPLVISAGISVACVVGIGMGIERLALRPLENAPWIAPLISTLALAMVADQAAELIWSADSHYFPNPFHGVRLVIGSAYITPVDLIILGVSLCLMIGLWLFLTRTWLGRALRAVSQDADAARQMGVRVNTLRQLAFGLGAGLAAIAGVLIAIYYEAIYPQMGLPFALKGFTAALLGGLSSIPGAVLGGILLGVLEAFAVGYVGEGFRDMTAFSVLLLILVFRPQGILGDARLDALGGARGASGAMPSTSIVIGQGGTPLAGSRLIDLPVGYLLAGCVLLALLPMLGVSNYVLQVGLGVVVFAILGVGLTLLSSIGILFAGFAGFLGIGAYVAAATAKDWGAGAELSFAAAAVATAVISGCAGLIFGSLTGAIVKLASLAFGVLVWLILLNADGLTGGASGVVGIPRPDAALLPGLSMNGLPAQYWQALAVLALTLFVVGRILASPVGRVLRAIREDRVAAYAAGLPVRRYTIVAFVIAGACAGLAGAAFAFQHRFISPDSFRIDTSVIAVVIVVLGGIGNMTGAILASILLLTIPELFREFADFRMIFFGLVLYLTLRFRPQGIAGVR